MIDPFAVVSQEDMRVLESPNKSYGAKSIKTCEGCTRNFLIPVPLSAKLAEKYCPECKPVMARLGQPLEDCSQLQDPLHRNVIEMSEINREYGSDLTRRQRLQLAWTQSFGKELDTLQRKQREMKIKQGGRYAKRG